MIRQPQEHFDASSNDRTRQSSIENIAFSQSPVIYKATSSKQIQKLAASLSKQIKTSELNCLFILDLLSAVQRPQKQINVDPIKICYEIPLKKVFPDFEEQNLEQILKELKFEKIIKDELSESNTIKQEGREKVKRPSMSLRIFPFHKSLKNFFMMSLPQVISPFSLFDILSYQKCQRICQVNYIFAYDDYEENVSKKLETEIMLNWGESQVKFYFPGKGSFELKPLEMIVIPGGSSYKWVSKECLTKLLAWRILPKKSLPFIVQSLQPEVPIMQIPYPIHQILIDYTFHEFPHIQIQNEELMYTLANLLNREFSKQLSVIEKQLKMDETQILNGGNDKKIDQCSKCGKFIINYFSFVRKDRKDSVYCVYCVKESLKINHVFQKMPKLTFQGGCELLTRIKSFKDQKIIQGQTNLQKLMKHIVFFQYEDICNGDFVGSYNSVHCKIHETDKKKVHNSHAKIIDNTITYLKSTLNVSSCADVIKQYSTVHYKNEAERKYFKQIMTKATYFMQESQQKELLSQLLPDYEEDSLKVFAIHLCAKDRI